MTTTALATDSLAHFAPHTCPKCSVVAPCLGKIEELFGWRTSQRRGTIPQSQCRECRKVRRDSNVADVMKTIRFGVEIEYTGGASRERVASAIREALGLRHGYGCNVQLADGRVWSVVYDGSVSSGGEVVSPILTWEDMDDLQKVVRAMKAAGCTTSEAEAGIHVHLDGERFTMPQARNLLRLVHRHEDLIYGLANVHSRRIGWCKRINESTFAEIEALTRRTATRASMQSAWYRDGGSSSHRYDGTRYHGVNFHALFNKGTIEFRYFNGTLHAGKVRAYAELCLALGAKAIDAPQISSKRKALTTLGNEKAVTKAARAFWTFLGTKDEALRTMRFHLENNLRSAYGVELKPWRAASSAQVDGDAPVEAPTPEPATPAPAAGTTPVVTVTNAADSDLYIPF